jgi:decaprenyl-phosphate phosphoribosyltransferase
VGGHEPVATSVAMGLLRAARPHQWVKNLLVVAAPAAAGVLTRADVLADVALAFGVFTAASAGTYLLNDVRDRHVDAEHPVKRHRPVASGLVTVPTAATVAVVCFVLALGIPVLVGIPELAGVLATYVALTTAYSLGLKHVAVLELAIVASGFVFRTVAGAVAASVPVSNWFLIVVSAGALHVVATKRFAEMRRTLSGETRRPVLHEYTSDVLAEIRFVTVAVAVTAYLLWAFERTGEVGGIPWYQLSAVPFTLAMFRYSAAVHEGAGEAPEDVILADRQLFAYALVWAVLFALGVYGGGV